jgi:hypothetical protein
VRLALGLLAALILAAPLAARALPDRTCDRAWRSIAVGCPWVDLCQVEAVRYVGAPEPGAPLGYRVDMRSGSSWRIDASCGAVLLRRLGAVQAGEDDEVER